MKIGLSTSVIQRGQTGIAQYVLSLVRQLASQPQPHEFFFYILEEDLPLFHSVRKTMRLIPVAEQFRPPIKNILWHQQVLPDLANLHQLDVLHVPSYRRMLWPRPCALVATVHDLASFRIDGKYDWKRMFYGRVVARWLARRQDQIIAISQTTARDIGRHFGLRGQQLNVIYNGVDRERFSPGPRGLARVVASERFGLTKPFFLFVARLEHPAKNHVRLIAAFNQYKAQSRSDWQLVLSGSDWHGAEVIRETIKRSPCASDIRCLGFVEEEALPMLYRGAEVFVYPSLYEGFGLPPLEAMACGCPVICSTRGALGEITGNAAAYVDPEDISSMTQQLLRVAGNEELREQLRCAGLQQASLFNWERTAAQTLDVYARAVQIAASRNRQVPSASAPRSAAPRQV